MDDNSIDTSISEESEITLDDLILLQTKIATQLSDLSQADKVPTGYKIKGGSFEAEEVDMASGSWLIRLLQIQAWLGLHSELVFNGDETEAAEKVSTELFLQINSEQLPNPVAYEMGYPALTLTGAELLATRLDSAIRLQEKFLELSETMSRKDATQSWVEAWDEELNSSSTVDGQIHATSETWELSEFYYHAEQGHLNLTPSYQRGDVWPTSDAQRLIESVVRGIPLPSIILLKAIKNKKSPLQYEVVDGKQRLTSILRFIGQHPEALKRVKEAEQKYGNDLEQLFLTNYPKFRKTWKRVVGETLTDAQETQYYFPFPLKAKAKALPQALAGKYYCEIKKERIEVGEGIETVYQLFEKKSQYKVPIILYTEASHRQIQEVFNLYNKQGKHLNAEEIRNALFHELDLVRLLLVAAGDNKNIAELAPYVPAEMRQNAIEISRYLDDYRFGAARYKRTKMLSWLTALLFENSENNGELVVRSTAKHIDALLTTIGDPKKSHWLAKQETLIKLLDQLHKCLDAHSGADCWDPSFKDDDNGTKWQELQLVASLVAVFLMLHGGVDVDETLASKRDALLEFTKSCKRPENAQNKTQWGFIGEAALGILKATDIDCAKVESSLLATYGIQCLSTLRAAQIHHKPR